MYFASAQLGANGYARDSGPGYKGGTPNVPGDISRGIINTNITEGEANQGFGVGTGTWDIYTYSETNYQAIFEDMFRDDNYKLYRPYKWDKYNK